MAKIIGICFTKYAVPYGNHGCKGGNMLYAFKYVIANEGVDTRKSYPFYGNVRNFLLFICACTMRERKKIVDLCMQGAFYIGMAFPPPPSPSPSVLQQSSCVYDKKYTGAKISGMVAIEEGNEKGLMGAVANVGPVAVAVDGKSNAFRVSCYMDY